MYMNIYLNTFELLESKLIEIYRALVHVTESKENKGIITVTNEFSKTCVGFNEDNVLIYKRHRTNQTLDTVGKIFTYVFFY